MMMVHKQAHGFSRKEEDDSKPQVLPSNHKLKKGEMASFPSKKQHQSLCCSRSSVNFCSKNKTNLSAMSDAPLIICSKSLVFHQRTKKQTHATSRSKKVRKRDGLMCKLLLEKQDQPECYEWCTIDFLFEEFGLPPKNQKTKPCDQQKKKVKMRDVRYYYGTSRFLKLVC